MKTGLMNSTWWTQPVWSAVDMTGGAGGVDDDQSGDESLGEGESGTGDDSTITGDDDFDLSTFWDEQGDDSEDGDGNKPPRTQNNQNDGNQDDPPADPVQAQIAANLKTTIESIAVGEDMIPPDFDVTDPKQFREVLGNALQNHAGTVLQMLFPTLKHALERQQGNLVEYIQQQIAENTDNTGARSLLESEIDIASDPKFKRVVDMVFGQSRTRAKGDTRKAVEMTKKALKSMGIPFKPSQSRPGGRGATPTVRTGNGALDMFLPLPAPVDSTRQQMRRPAPKK